MKVGAAISLSHLHTQMDVPIPRVEKRIPLYKLGTLSIYLFNFDNAPLRIPFDPFSN